jgi:hypothetical protein
MHMVFRPLTLVDSAVWPGIGPITMHLVVFPVSTIFTEVCINQGALALFESIFVLASINYPILPKFFTKAGLLVILPRTSIATNWIIKKLQCVISLNQFALTMGLAIGPISLIDVPIGVYKLPMPVWFTIQPKSFIHWMVFPGLDSVAWPQMVQGCTDIDGRILKVDRDKSIDGLGWDL